MAGMTANVDRLYEILALFMEHDIDGNGTMDIDEFTRLYDNYLKVADLSSRSAVSTFQEIDKNSGSLYPKNLDFPLLLTA